MNLLPFLKKKPQTSGDPQNLQELIDLMTAEATQAAHLAWSACEKTGYVGSLPMSTLPRMKAIHRKYFLIGYAMALLDHTMDSTRRLKAAQEAQEVQGLNRVDG
jgi:hypothetical protein